MTVSTGTKIGPATYKANGDYIYEKWFRYVQRGATGKSLEDFTTTDGNVDVSDYTPEQIADWQECVNRGYVASLSEHAQTHTGCH
jgi:hypothetical protein